MRRSKPTSVTLGPQQARLKARLKSGEYASASEVLRSALRALDREDAAFDAFLRARVEAALKDPRGQAFPPRTSSSACAAVMPVD